MKINFLLIFINDFYFNTIFIALFEAAIFQTNDFFALFFNSFINSANKRKLLTQFINVGVI